LLEKDVNLAIALKVRDLLAPVVEVGMTRATDMALDTK
jgi:N-acetylmuramoyl-L-alanine amidase